MASSHHLRDHIRSLLPRHRHAIFHARVVVHDVASIPLVCGDFALKWRFQNAHNTPNESRKGKDKEGIALSAGSRDDVSEASDSTSSSPKKSTSSSDSSSFRSVPTPSGGNTGTYGQFLGPDDTPPDAEEDETQDEPEVPPSYTSSAKGRTDFFPLLPDHSIPFNQQIDVDLEMTVDKDTANLHPSELKLSLLEDLSTDERTNTTEALGIIMINLAEYANAGIVTRRYLLRKSKVNATFKITIEVTHAGGEPHYIPPPLRKGQILSGVSDLLARERLLQSAVKLESLGRSSSSSFSGDTPSRPAFSPRPSNYGHIVSQAPSALPSASTEAIINGLFNPFPSSSNSPFTIPLPKQATLDPDPDNGALRRPSLDGSSVHSGLSRNYSVSSGSRSVSGGAPDNHSASGHSTHTHQRFGGGWSGKPDSEKKEESGGRWWKFRSRPSTPVIDAPSYRSGVDSSRPSGERRSTSTQGHRTPLLRPPPAIAVTDVDR